MADDVDTICPGCGCAVSYKKEGVDEKFHASYGCLSCYHDLLFYTLSRNDAEFIHQHAVDTYAAQRVWEKTKPITITFALVGLYLALECGYSGKEVQHMHMVLSRRNKEWPVYKIPLKKAEMTVADVVAVPDEKKSLLIHQWMESVWDMWDQEHEHINSLLLRYASDIFSSTPTGQ